MKQRITVLATGWPVTSIISRQTVQKLTGRGIRIQFVKENFTFTGEDSPMPNLKLSIMGAVAEFERALIREWQREGIAPGK